MKDINKVILVGRLGADPIRRETKTGKSVTVFSLATSRRLKESETAAESPNAPETSASPDMPAAVEESPWPAMETQWHKVSVWGKAGENCSRYLRKGDAVYVEGSLRSQKYEGKEGITKISFEVMADEVSFLGSPRRKLANDPTMTEEVAAS